MEFLKRQIFSSLSILKEGGKNENGSDKIVAIPFFLLINQFCLRSRY